MYDIINRFQIIINNNEELLNEIKDLFEEIKKDDSKKSEFIAGLNQILTGVVQTRNIDLINLVFKDAYEMVENLENQESSNNNLSNLELSNLEFLLSNSIFTGNNSIIKFTLDLIKKIYSLNGIKIQEYGKYPGVFWGKIMEIYNGNDGESLVSELLNYYYDNNIENLNVVNILKDDACDLEAFNGFCSFLYEIKREVNCNDIYNIIILINTCNTEHLNSKVKNILNLMDESDDFYRFLKDKENNSKILNIISCLNVENFEKFFGENPQNFINFKNKDGYNILDYACLNKNYELIEYILNKKEGEEYFYDTLKNKKENSKLLDAISYFNVENFEKLFGKNLKEFMSFEDEKEYGILDFVCSNLYSSGNFRLLEYLLKNGADINKTKKVTVSAKLFTVSLNVLPPFLDFFGDILLEYKNDDKKISRNIENKIGLFIETIANLSPENQQIKLETASNIFGNINRLLMKGIKTLYWMFSKKIDLKNIEPICNLTINAINSLYAKNGIEKRIDNVDNIKTDSVDSLKSLADSLIANINDCVSAICKEKERKIAEQKEEIQNVLNDNGNSDIEVGSSTMDKLESFIDANLDSSKTNIIEKSNLQDSGKNDSEEVNNGTKEENIISDDNIIKYEQQNFDIDLLNDEQELASSSNNEDDGVYEEQKNASVEISEDISTKNNENINNIDLNNNSTDIRSISESNLTMNNNSNNDLDSDYISDTQDDSANNYSLDKSSSVVSEQNRNDNSYCNNDQESKKELSKDSTETETNSADTNDSNSDVNSGSSPQNSDSYSEKTDNETENDDDIQESEDTGYYSENDDSDSSNNDWDWDDEYNVQNINIDSEQLIPEEDKESIDSNNTINAEMSEYYSSDNDLNTTLNPLNSNDTNNSDSDNSLANASDSETENATEINEDYLLKTNKENRYSIEYIKNLASFINKKVNENSEKNENIKKHNEDKKFKRKFNNIFKIFENITLPKIKINNKTVVDGGFGGEILYDKKTKKINAIRFSEDSFIMRELDNPEYEKYKYLKDIFKNGIPVWYSGIDPNDYYEIFVNTLEEFKIDPYSAFKKLADIPGVQLINPINHDLINYNENMENIPLFLALIVKKRKQLEEINKLENEITKKLGNRKDRKLVKNISDIAVKILTNHSFEQSVIPNSTIEGRNRLIDYIINLLGNINITGEIKNISKDTKSSLLSVFESKRILGFTRYIDENLSCNLANINEEIDNVHGNFPSIVGLY